MQTDHPAREAKLKLIKPARATEAAVERARFRRADIESRLATALSALGAARDRLRKSAADGLEDIALSKLEAAVLAAEQRCATLRGGLEGVVAELAEAESALEAVKAIEHRLALAAGLAAAADDIENSLPTFNAATRDLARGFANAGALHIIGIGEARQLADVLPRLLEELQRPAIALVDDLRRYAAAVASGGMPTKDLRLPTDGAHG
jgi:hypothetical protein